MKPKKTISSYLFFQIVIIILSFFNILETKAQTSSLSGTVQDQPNKQALAFTTVALYNSADSLFFSSTSTNESGKFIFKDINEGNYYLLIRFIGYQTKKIKGIQLIKNLDIDLGIIDLVASAKLLKEVVVNGEKEDTQYKEDRQVYSAKQFQSAAGGTAVDLIKNLPSVSVGALGEISIRGSSGFIVMLNGKPVQSDPSTLLSQIPANTIENIEIITSPSAKYDADGKGGIINIITKSGTDDGTSLLLNALGGLPSTNDFNNKEKPLRYGADATLNYKKEKWDLSVGGSYYRNDNSGRREGDVYTIIGNRYTSFPSVGERSFKKFNYSSRLTLAYNLNKNNNFKLGFYNGIRTEYRRADVNYINSTTNLATGQNIGRINYYNPNLVKKHGEFYIANLEYIRTLNTKSNISFSGLFESDQFSGKITNLNITKEGLSDTLQYTLNTNNRPLTAYRLKIDYVLNIGKGKLESGYQFRYLQDKGSFIYLQKNKNFEPLVLYPEFSGNVFVDNYIHSLYTQYSGSYQKKLSYTGGLRYEYAVRNLFISENSQNLNLTLSNLFPSATILYQINEHWQAKGGYSRRVQRSTGNELNPLAEREHSETLEHGDANILPEFIGISELGMVHRLKTGSLSATFYHQNIENVVNRVNSVYADTILNRIYTNAGNARRIGFEAGLDLKPFDWWKIYLGGNVYDYRIKGNLFNNTVNVNNSSLVYNINANTNFKLSKTTNLQWNLNYLSERVTAQGMDSRFFSFNASIKKTFINGKLSAILQWQNIDIGLLHTNEQRITTFGKDYYTTTNYILEKDIFIINLSYNLNQRNKKIKFTESEFGEKEF